ncbi:hypothetical protein DSO57_1025853 [Entomophthora muscae]|uniref:Uncharacterized protein n=1 Tax=Entomophthora muscae TaxID=34485 RepID=A0ACC2TPP5_9FUNG|nr:hypothetical protein DSO57_1025853 [Entomophthora muscae]
MVKVVSKVVSSSTKESLDSPVSGSRDARPVLGGPSFKAGRPRANSKFLSPRPKPNIKKRKPTPVDNNLYLAHIPMEELGDLLLCNRAGLILGAFLDLDKPQLTSEIYNLLVLPKMVKCFFDFWLESTSHPSNIGLSVMQICKRSFNLLTILSSPQAFSENLIDENIHQIMEQVSRYIMAPSKPYIAEPSQPTDVEQNFHHLKMGVELLLKKKPSDVRRWLLTTRHAQTQHQRPPVFGLLNHLHHPSVLPLLGGLLFDLVEGLASHTAALEAFALHGFFETIWNGVWKESRGQA